MVEFVAILLALIVALSGLVYYQHHCIRILQTRIKWRDMQHPFNASLKEPDSE